MLSALNGTAQGALANKELIGLMLPMLRADMTIVQSHCYGLEAPLACGITAFGGDADPTVDKAGLMRWRAQTTSVFRLHVIEGDHFFLKSNRAPILDVLRETLQLVASAPEHDAAVAGSARAQA